ncbi:MAG: J domain-containing protein [Solirubrobacteraceae bacterium]|nr:J domain-containing protein [Solirubrobacteraceae bacterium]
MSGASVDPHEVLGVAPDASPTEVAVAFRALAKRWHPDRGAASGADPDRMALVNAAYDALRAGASTGGAPPAARPASDGAVGRRPTDRPSAATRRPPDLAPAVARALGAELRAALGPGETVRIVVPASTWASPQTTLAVSDRRLLWLLDDAPVHRVRELALADVRRVAVRGPRWWRRRTVVDCVDRRGRRTGFGDLPPLTAHAVARHVRDGANLE